MLCDFEFEFKVYWDLVEELKMVDFECVVKVFGVCFVYLIKDGVLFECVLMNYMLIKYIM